MKSVNLIPAPRRDAKRRRRQRRACTAVCGAYAIVLAGAVGFTQLGWRTGGHSLGERLSATDAAIQRLEHQTAEARSELSAARATVEANRIVAEQPDWSILLALLAKTTGKDVVLKTITIAPPTTLATPASNAANGGAVASKSTPEFALEVSGVGRTPLAVSQHVLRLEQTGLFSKVALLDTGREAFLNENSVAFRLQCTFGDGRARGTPSPTIVSVPPAAEVSNLDAEGVTR
jgi:hypothetical protein